MISVVRRFRVRDGAIADVVQATRGYQQKTRTESGNQRCELWQDVDDPCAFTLFEVFRDAHARTVHALASHVYRWESYVTPSLEGTFQDEQAEALVADVVPPPLPVRPTLEQSFGAALEAARGARPPPPQPPRRLLVDVEMIEVASARDHIPFRAAQPCVVLGSFVVRASGVDGVGRTVYRFSPPKSLPSSLIGGQRLMELPLLHASPLKLGIVAISVEENGGTDVQSVYQALSDAHALSFWDRGESEPTPSSLSECATVTAFHNTARRVQVLRNERVLSDLMRDDTWAGAALGFFDLPANGSRLARFHTAAEDGRNDWLLTLRCHIG